MTEKSTFFGGAGFFTVTCRRQHRRELHPPVMRSEKIYSCFQVAWQIKPIDSNEISPSCTSSIHAALHGEDHAGVPHRRQERLQEDPAQQSGGPHHPGHWEVPPRVLLLHPPAEFQRWGEKAVWCCHSSWVCVRPVSKESVSPPVQRPCSSAVTSPSSGSESSSWSSRWDAGSSSLLRCPCRGSSPITSWRPRKLPWWSKNAFWLVFVAVTVAVIDSISQPSRWAVILPSARVYFLSKSLTKPPWDSKKTSCLLASSFCGSKVWRTKTSN